MPELILLRHAKAVDKSVNDFDRELTADGQRQAERIGRLLARRDAVPDLVVSSPAARAWQTAVASCREMGIAESDLVSDAAVYDAEVVQLVDVLERRGHTSKRLMLVGHNPGLTDLGAYLLKPAPDDWGLGKGVAAQLHLEGSWSAVAKAEARLGAVMEP